MTVSQLKYKEIEKELELLLERGIPGDRIPSDRELASTYKCNIQTLRKAFSPFVKNGRIVRRTGSGTFIAETPQKSMIMDIKKIGMLIHANSDSYAFTVIRAIHNASKKYDITIRTAIASGYEEEARMELSLLVNDGCSAVIIPWVPFNEISELAGFVRNATIPVTTPVLIPGLESNYFESHDLAGLGSIAMAKTACEYFRLLGEKRIALLGPDSHDDLSMKNKLCGYSEYVYRNKLENIVALVGTSSNEMDELAEQWKKYRGNLAVICYDDVYALRFIMTMHKHGLSAPDDFRIMGDNDTKEAMLCDPPLSSCRADYANLGENNLKAAMAMARGECCPPSIAASNRFIIRGSCGGTGRITAEIAEAVKSFSKGLVIIPDGKDS
ncbi:MAG: substrate-binding domain-containing protein [Victivallales bacterium]|nr:substrate-binding domain-containing protein [Victivallales bacterium]